MRLLSPSNLWLTLKVPLLNYQDDTVALFFISLLVYLCVRFPAESVFLFFLNILFLDLELHPPSCCTDST